VTGEKIGSIPAVVLESDESEGVESPPVHEDDADIEEQGFWTRRATSRVRELELDGDTLQRSLDDITAKLEKVLENQNREHAGGFALESFSVGLAVEGKGKLCLVAEVGVEASIELTFSRRHSS
jgi:hypothetical protein